MAVPQLQLKRILVLLHLRPTYLQGARDSGLEGPAPGSSPLSSCREGGAPNTPNPLIMNRAPIDRLSYI